MMSDDNEKNYRKMLELQQSIQYLQQYLQEIEAQVQELEMIHDSLQDFSYNTTKQVTLEQLFYLT